MSNTSPRLYSVHLNTVAKPALFDAGSLEVKPGDKVVVETARGQELGELEKLHSVVDKSLPVYRILRLATQEDLCTQQRHSLQAAEALEIIKERVLSFDLPMQVLDASITLDGNYIVVEFAAENRVDFRSLVKDLAPRLRKRIELHQIGTRDRATLLGGLGLCGRHLCCGSWLHDFSSVSIKMAKIQGIMFNPYRISGACGRLMCCLKFENDVYKNFTAGLPTPNDIVSYASGTAKVIGYNISRKTVSLQKDNEVVEISGEEAKELTIIASADSFNRQSGENEDGMYSY